MSHADSAPKRREREKVTLVLVRGMFVLALSALVIVAYARLTDRPLEAMPPADVPVLAERAIVLDGAMNGSARVLDARGEVIATLSPEAGGFIAGVHRVLVRERNKHGADIHAPVRLVRWADGRIGLRDDLTGWRAELIGFGKDNYAAFARLLD